MDRNTKILVELLGKGTMTQSEIARTFDVSPSAISQIATRYKEEIAEMGAASKVAKLGLDAKIDKLEEQILDQMTAKSEFETDLRVLTGMFKILNSSHRRGRGEVATSGQRTTATLQLNQQFIQQNVSFIKDTQGQVVQVGDTHLTTASSDHVNDMALEHEATIKAASLPQEVTADDIMPSSQLVQERSSG